MNDEECEFNWNTEGGTKQFTCSSELVSPKKFRPTSLICGNFQSLRKLLLNHVEYIEI